MRGRQNAFSDDEIRKIRAEAATKKWTQTQLATRWDTSQVMISQIVNRKYYKNVI